MVVDFTNGVNSFRLSVLKRAIFNLDDNTYVTLGVTYIFTIYLLLCLKNAGRKPILDPDELKDIFGYSLRNKEDVNFRASFSVRYHHIRKKLKDICLYELIRLRKRRIILVDSIKVDGIIEPI